jgi:endonuclease/exonuclease/phosphatase family metal-dependent hydrolase
MLCRLVSICLLCAGISRAPAFSLLQYNCKGNGATDWSTNAPQVQAIGREVMYLQPDVITFNEIPQPYSYQMTNFMKVYLPGYSLVMSTNGDGFITTAIASRYPITRFKSWLHQTDLTPYGAAGAKYTRDLFEAQLAVPEFPQPVHIFNSHLKASTDSASLLRRAAEAGAVSNFFFAGFLTTNATHPYVLTGDLNEDINRPPSGSQQPIQRLVNAATGLQLTTPVNPYTGDDRTISIQTGLSARFDYILPCISLYWDITTNEVFRTDLLPNPPPPLLADDGQTASDHLPVFMVFTVNTNPPSITAQPQDALVSASQPVTFSVAVAGALPFGYQWRFAGDDIVGATNTSYTVASAQASDMGPYSVIVTNPLGFAVSSNALLVVAQSVAWGDNTEGQSSLVPSSTNFIAVAAGARFSVGLRADGRVIAWGNDLSGQCDVPAGLQDAVAIAAGGYHSLAIRANGTVVAWGANDSGQTTVPAGLARVIGIGAGTWHSVALRADGTVAVWGDNSFGQTNMPAGLSNVVAVAVGGNHTLALTANGTVVAWGENTDADGSPAGQSVVPLGLTNVVAIWAGQYHSLAMKLDSTLVAWGDDTQGQCDVPVGLTNVVAAAGGGAHSVALGADGTVTAWGADWNGQCDIPPTLAPATGIAAGQYHTLVLLAGSMPVPRLLNPGWQVNRFSALAQTLSPKNYALEYKDSLVATNWTAASTNAGNGALRVLADPTASDSLRFYRMRQW